MNPKPMLIGFLLVTPAWAQQTTPLHDAAAARDLAKVRQLLDQGANVNARNRSDQWTPLHWAAVSDKTDVAAALILRSSEGGNGRDRPRSSE